MAGLIFPSNGELGWQETARFEFKQPFEPFPATYIWRVNPRQQAGYYTTFFWGDASEDFNASYLYYGFHPYPDPPPKGVEHDWEISTDGIDVVGEKVEYGRWYTQAARVYQIGTTRYFEFYWDWPDTSKVIRTQYPAAEQPNMPRIPVLTFGDAPWAQNNEACSCTLRGIQVYDELLSMDDIGAEIAKPMSVAQPWYLNLNPTPDDISDQSGSGHNPVWVSNNRPDLYTE